jgi:hypothetical protein
MKLEEAIEFNQALEKDLRAKGLEVFPDAVHLGIEALKEVIILRPVPGCPTRRLLLGETEE